MMEKRPLSRNLSEFFSLEKQKLTPTQHEIADFMQQLLQKCMDEAGGDAQEALKSFVSHMDSLAMEYRADQPDVSKYFLRISSEVRSQFSMEKQ